MELTQFLKLILFIFAGLLLFRWKDAAEQLAAAISALWGGGPGSPSHPIPANDSRILNRSRRGSASTAGRPRRPGS